LDGILGHSILAHPNGSLYVTDNDAKKPNNGGSVWLIKDGKKKQVDAGIKFATGMAFRPDQWLLSVGEGHSKWAYSYQIADDGTLIEQRALLPPPRPRLGRRRRRRMPLLLARRPSIHRHQERHPNQRRRRPHPGHPHRPRRGRVTGVAIGGKDKDTLYAFCGNKIWKRKIQQHALGAWSPWTKVVPNKL
jgi:gluconolactonase